LSRASGPAESGKKANGVIWAANSYVDSRQEQMGALVTECHSCHVILSGLSRSTLSRPGLGGMAEIHDQFETILILDFGSQVRV
jgi:hypothetical protein